MGKSGGEGAGEGAEGIGCPVGEIAAAAVRSVKLMPFVGRAVERNRGAGDDQDAPPGPFRIPPEREREQHGTDGVGTEMNDFIRDIEGVHFLDPFPAERGQDEDAERPTGDGEP